MTEKVESNEPQWLGWARELQLIGQAGLTYSKNEHDLERFRQILSLSTKMMAVGSGEQVKKIEGLFAEEVGYLTPKVDIRAALFNDNKILLVRETADQNKWTLPGGWADINASPSENIEREVLEEAGLRVSARKLLAVLDRARQGHTPHPNYMYKLFFQCEIIDGDLKTGHETGEVRFFSEDELPEEKDLSLSRIQLRQLKRMFEHYRNPELPTDFD